jgi:RNA polymerase sigma-70 factor (ECF subfamily)
LEDRRQQFEQTFWPQLRGAYNLARWISGNDHDAEDVVQESFAKAFQAYDRFRGGDPRTWLLAIVRNTAINFIQRRRPKLEVAWSEHQPEPRDTAADPEARLVQQSRRDQIRGAIERLPREFRETLVLREIEGLSYKEIAAVLGVPAGTVMSRLSRARNLMLEELMPDKGGRP